MIGPEIRNRSLQNCAVREVNAAGVPGARCWRYLIDGKTCPRHGDVSHAQKVYAETGKLTIMPRPVRK
jgi:hypothetical protein